jgi:hypothetical protein
LSGGRIGVKGSFFFKWGDLVDDNLRTCLGEVDILDGGEIFGGGTVKNGGTVNGGVDGTWGACAKGPVYIFTFPGLWDEKHDERKKGKRVKK